MDERGRVTIGKRIGRRYGRGFFVIEAPGEVVLIPKSKDPIKELKEWGRKAGIKNLTPQEVRRLAEEEAYKEIGSRSKRVRSKR